MQNENVQTIVQNGKPVFVVIPYDDYERMKREVALAVEINDETIFPLEVTEMHVLKKFSLPKAWRIYRGKTQRDMASALGISQGAYSQIEKSTRNQIDTLRKLAKVLNVTPAQLAMD